MYIAAFQVRKWLLDPETNAEFSRSPFFESPFLTARLHPGARIDVSNSSSFLPKTGPRGPVKEDCQKAETAIRSETVAGSGDMHAYWLPNGWELLHFTI